MNYTALLQAVGLCLASVVIEAAGTTRSGKVWFENLKQPKYSISFKIWYIVGGLYYIICGVIGYRLFNMEGDSVFLRLLPLGLMMLANGAGNFILFRMRSLKGFFLSLYPFIVIIIILYIQLLNTDKISSWVLLPYMVWLIYDYYYLRELWKLNQ